MKLERPLPGEWREPTEAEIDWCKPGIMEARILASGGTHAQVEAFRRACADLPVITDETPKSRRLP